MDESEIPTPEFRSWLPPASFPSDLGGYRLIGLLGRGGMGTVYEAEQLATGRRVAVKVLEQEIDSPEMRQRFLREGRLAAAINHPNSVYIFGTEEIDGIPVIVMEVADSGTLKDTLKRRGPLPVHEAVDAILDVIAGLEEAHAGGVLHRDVKPSNCFVSPDGTVKVGDFGLSVSTLLTGDTFLTASGGMLGTPSFAPPEQLRGDGMDVRADIYSVGATLFTLLTGEAPFTGENAVQVVARVLDEKPKMVTDLRSEVPARLAQIVAQCLAKKPGHRFPDYQSLRKVLLPFSSCKSAPAPLSLRFLAGIVDEAMCVLPGMLLIPVLGQEPGMFWLSNRTFDSALPWLGWCVFYLAYHAVPEGLWGATLGKSLFGMRVSRKDGQSPGLARALLRATMAMVAWDLVVYFRLFTTTAAEYREVVESGTVRPLDFLFLVTWALLFVTMRRSNGYANLMDLASGTRVVNRLQQSSRPRLHRATESELPLVAKGRMGPYEIVEEIAVGRWIRAYDRDLRRGIWLWKREGEMSQVRKELGRPGRLRWLQQVEREGTVWDAFEAPSGSPLRAVLAEGGRPHWASVRQWLNDIAGELDSSARDRTNPAELSIDQVWITARGRGMVLEHRWPDPGGDCVGTQFSAASPEEQQKFLRAVADTADPTTIPLHARAPIESLSAGAYDKMSFAAGTIQSLLAKPCRLSHARRIASILTAPAVFAIFMSCGLLILSNSFQAMDDRWKASYPELPPLSEVMRFRNYTPDQSLKSDIERHIAGHYAGLSESLAGEPDLTLYFPEEREQLRSIIETYPDITAERLAEADRKLMEQLDDFRKWELIGMLFGLFGALGLFAAQLGLIQLPCLLLFRGTPGQYVFGFAVVNKRGERAGRLRLLGRWLVIWLPIILIAFWAFYERQRWPRTGFTMADAKSVLYAAVWLIGLAIALAFPRGGVQDWVAGTRIVPR